MFVVFLQKIDFGGNSQLIFDFVGNFLYQIFVIGNANHFSIVVFADIDFTSLYIGEAANPI
jgi:hypothetical protein